MINRGDLVFIDESGDTGLTGSKTRYFIIAAVVITNEAERHLIQAKMIEYRRLLGWHEQEEFKFSRTRKSVIKELLRLLKPYDYHVYSVIFDKMCPHSTVQNRYSLYNYLLADLVKTIPSNQLHIWIDGESGKKHRKQTLTYLRQQCAEKSIHNFRYVSSTKCEELQLADLVAGSINRTKSQHQDKQDYFKLIQNKVRDIKSL